ncbi:conserved Plasmodium protein, unknown function [Plasmodium ovale]|uniref:CFAP65-like ninth Ig-like domain-containing protein n=1 Tax=Plasmodium ovale TaxID=36330 RepID=A0A1D3THZ3_PLAOA|nr:conserved Plasmodium protein, unknown function [Plasmodium ovale]
MENYRMYGLDFPPEIEFRDYEGGVKIIKRLTIKNTTKNIIKFRFLFQSSTYFTYPLQEIENISPGLTKSYLISFMNPLNDYKIIYETLNILIYDKQKDKKIYIKLIATPLKCDVVFPSVLNFKEIVIKQKTTEEFILRNQGTLNTIIKLSHKNFTKKKKLKIKIEPSQFILKSNQKINVHLVIHTEIPQNYTEYISCSIIEIPKHVERKIFSSDEEDTMNTTINPYDNEENIISDIIKILNQENVEVCLIKKKIQINWISVLPQIIILSDEKKNIFNKSIINFGKIILGQRITKSIFLQNLTKAPINIMAKKQKENDIFTFTNEKFTLKEMSKEEIVLSINGNNPVNEYTEVIQFKACNDYCIELFLICEIKSIKLQFQKTMYLFENTKVGDIINEKITMRNDENIDLYVEVVNTGYIFNVKNKKFIIKKNSYYSLNLECNCIYPINSFKRLYFLVHLNKQIFYIDVICNFSTNYQMCPISMHHIYRYKHLIHDKNTIYNSYYDKNEYIDIWDFPVEFDSYKDTPHELLSEIMDIGERDVFAVPKELDISEFEEKDLMIINKTPIEYTCVWSNALDKKIREQSIFEITPSEAQLPPLSYQKFRVKNVKNLKEKYTREIYECVVFPSNNKDYTKCNSKTLLPPLFLYVTLFQFKTKYLCETEKIDHSLLFFPRNISFQNMIEGESMYIISKFENNTDLTQIIDFTQFKNELDGIKVYPQINYVPRKSFLNVIIFYTPQKRELAESEIKIYYLVNGIEKKCLSIYVSHEINNVVLNKGEPNINLPCVSTETESAKKIPIENMTERNVLCLLIKEDLKDIVNIHIGGKDKYSEHLTEENVKEFERKDIDTNEETRSFINEENKYNFYFFCLSPFEKKNIYISAFCHSNICKSVPLLFTYLLYVNDEDMKNKFTYLKKNMKDHIKTCKQFIINVNIVKCSLILSPKIVESEPITPGRQFNAKIRIKNEHPVRIKFRTRTEISQIDGTHIFEQEEIVEAEKYIMTKKNEDVISSFSEKYFYVSFNSKRKGRFVYRFFVIVGENKSSVDIILNVVMPYFQIIDINDFKTPTSVYWNMTSIDKINAYLKEHLSKIEVEYKKSQGIEHMKKLFSEFDYIEFNIGNNVLNEETYVNMVLYNPLDTPLNVHINTIRSYILPILPPYVKNQEEQLAHLLYEDNAFRNFMRCLDSCEISPMQFEIKKKSTIIVTLLYKHKYVGFHNMPLIIEAENGKIVPLNLCCLTFQPNVPPIYLMNVKDLNQHILGLKNECIINVDLLNDSELDIFYNIEKNNNFTVLNSKGVIKRREYISLFILISRLSPSIIRENLILKSYFKHLQKDIELKKMEIELNINCTSKDIYKDSYKKINVFNNKCINDVDDQHIKTYCSNFIPAYSYIHAQNKLFYITPSSISIIYAPTNSLVERIVIIKNYSLSKDLKFKISNKDTLPGNILEISPSKGIIKSREQTIMRFTFILSDVLLDIEGNIQIELKFVENTSTVKSENEDTKKEVYEDTRENNKTKIVDAKLLSTSKKKKEKGFDDLTFSHAQKIFDNIQMFKYTYDNVNSNMLQKAVRRLYGVSNGIDEKENSKETTKQGVTQQSQFYFYIHVKLFTCNSDNAVTEKKNFENLIKTNIYPKLLYFKKYIRLPIPLEDKSKSFFKRRYLDFDKLEKWQIQNEQEDATHYKEKIIYHKRDIYCYMFSEMFKSIIKKHIKKHIAHLFEISACSIQTIDSILGEDFFDTMTRNQKTDLKAPIEEDYSFLKPTILSHFFSHIFSDVIKNLINENVTFTKKLD